MALYYFWPARLLYSAQGRAPSQRTCSRRDSQQSRRCRLAVFPTTEFPTHVVGRGHEVSLLTILDAWHSNAVWGSIYYCDLSLVMGIWGYTCTQSYYCVLSANGIARAGGALVNARERARAWPDTRGAQAMFMYASDPRIDPQRRRETNAEHCSSPHSHPHTQAFAPRRHRPPRGG